MSGLGGRQTGVNVQPAVGVAGDFCDLNPRYTLDAGAGALVAGPGGCFVGRFAWVSAPVDSNGASGVVNNFGTGKPAGFIAREQQGLNTVYLADGSQFIPAGFPVTVFTGGGFWMGNTGASQALPGQKAYAAYKDGRVNFAATGTPTGGGTSTASTIAATTSSVTASITGNIMSVSAVGSGTVYPGTTLSGTNVTTGSVVVSQLTPLLTGEALGGVGRYYVSIPEQTVASTTISGTYGLLTVGGTVVSGFAVNDVLAVSGSVVAGTVITALGTGTGAAGTYVVNNNTAVSSQAINVASINVETSFVASSSGLANELVKASNQPAP
jgi:hypothetical protein